MVCVNERSFTLILSDACVKGVPTGGSQRRARCSIADSEVQGNVNCRSSHLFRIACGSGDQKFSAKLSASPV